MTERMVDRRSALAIGGAAMLAPTAAAAGATAPTCGIMLFDPRSAQARAIARAVPGQQLIALVGDPVRLWRDRLATARGPIGGVTNYSDYIILRGLAAEQGLRIRHETPILVSGAPMLVRWTAA